MSRQLTSGVLGRKKKDIYYGYYPEQEVFNLINNEGYRPIATYEELDAIRNTNIRNWGCGTKFMVTGLEGGRDKKYILVKDIDASGNIWSGITLLNFFTFDGNGCLVNKLKSDYAFFIGTGGENIVRNLGIINADIQSTERASVILLLLGNDNCIVENCFSTGFAKSGVESILGASGGIVGQAANTNSVIKNNFSVTTIIPFASSRNGSVLGQNQSTINNCYGLGRTSQPAGQVNNGAAVGRNFGTQSAVYYNSETVPINGSIARTTNEMLNGEPSGTIYTGWDTDIWEFTPNRYPILKVFGETPANYPPVGNIQNSLSGDTLTISWDDAPVTTDLIKYRVFQGGEEEFWEEIGETTGTNLNIDVSAYDAGIYKFFVIAMYKFRAFEMQNSSSILTTITL